MNKEIKFRRDCPIEEYPLKLIDEIKKQFNLINDKNKSFSTGYTVDTLIHWSKTEQGHDFWADLSDGRDMSRYTEWLHLFDEVNTELNYEIY